MDKRIYQAAQLLEGKTGLGSAVSGRDFFQSVGLLVERADGEKFVAAGSAAERRDAQQSATKREKTGHMFAGNFLEIKIAADAAMSVEQEPKRDWPGVESPFAFLAAPGDDADHSE